MQRHLERELDRLSKKFDDLCKSVNSNFNRLFIAMENDDINQIMAIKEDDKKIDNQEIIIEEECLKLLALYQPVASDLRMIVAILKINNDMERIGDLTSNISERCLDLYNKKMPLLDFLIPSIYKNVEYMLDKSIKCINNRDLNLAMKVCKLDDEVDNMHSRMYSIVKEKVVEHPQNFEGYMNYISISRFLERIADHSTNIAEDILYMLEGEIYRHRINSTNKHNLQQDSN